jgi:hypothetical protein
MIPVSGMGQPYNISTFFLLYLVVSLCRLGCWALLICVVLRRGWLN